MPDRIQLPAPCFADAVPPVQDKRHRRATVPPAAWRVQALAELMRQAIFTVLRENDDACAAEALAHLFFSPSHLSGLPEHRLQVLRELVAPFARPP